MWLDVSSSILMWFDVIQNHIAVISC